MNTPSGPATPSPLQQDIGGNQSAAFNTSFMNGINNKTGFETDTLQYSASVTCRNGTSIIQTPFADSRNLTGGEHAVRVTECSGQAADMSTQCNRTGGCTRNAC